MLLEKGKTSNLKDNYVSFPPWPLFLGVSEYKILTGTKMCGSGHMLNMTGNHKTAGV